MRDFLLNTRGKLLQTCEDKVAQRLARGATREQLKHGVPLFLDQLTRTLQAEADGDPTSEFRISGPSGGDGAELSEMGASARIHGGELLWLGYTIDQVVHDYGDLCQAITDLAVASDTPFSVEEFRTLNRSLDNAIAEAVTEFAAQRDLELGRRNAQREAKRIGSFAHELRNHLHVAKLAFTALESGRIPVGGSTGAVLRRSLGSLQVLVDRSLESIRESSASPLRPRLFSLEIFLAEASRVAELYAANSGCDFRTAEVDAQLAIEGNRELLSAALGNLLENAFKFSQPSSAVSLHAHTSDGWILIDVEDCCGGLPNGAAGILFEPFSQAIDDKRGLGLGLSIAKHSVEADGGRLTVQDRPGKGCIFTIALPQRRLA